MSPERKKRLNRTITFLVIVAFVPMLWSVVARATSSMVCSGHTSEVANSGEGVDALIARAGLKGDVRQIRPEVKRLNPGHDVLNGLQPGQQVILPAVCR